MTGREWRLSLLGGWRLEHHGVVVNVMPATQRLLALVALRGPCARPVLAATLWPDVLDARAATNLRAALYRVNLQLPGVLGAHRDPVALDPDVDVDARCLLSGLPAGGCKCHGHTGVLLDRGRAEDLLPGWYDEWLQYERERVRQLWLHTVEERADALARGGEYRMAIDVALVALAAEPLRESAHRLLVRLHLAEGNVAEAIKAYERCRRLLADELGLAPTEQLTRLVAELQPTTLPGPPIPSPRQAEVVRALAIGARQITPA